MGPLFWINDFDTVEQVPIDYMHCVLLGVCKKLLKLWCHSKNHHLPFYIGRETVHIDTLLRNLRPPNEITRLPGQVAKLSDWKGTYFKSIRISSSH